jgi:hypothetical protein
MVLEMFLTDDAIEGGLHDPDTWRGTYRGGEVVAVTKRIGVREFWKAGWEEGQVGKLAETLERALAGLKCQTDYDLWLSEIPADLRRHALHAGMAIGDKLMELADRGEVEGKTVRELSELVIDEVTSENVSEGFVGWLHGLGENQRYLLVNDFILWRASIGTLEGISGLEGFGMEKTEFEPEPPRPRPEASRKKPAPPPEVSWEPTIPLATEVISRPFGYCKRCRTCLAYDVNHGCCTSCGMPLSKNPAAAKCGECFSWAYKDVVAHGGTLMHGKVTWPESDGAPTPHAWVERGGTAYDWQTMKAAHGGKHRGRGYPIKLFYDLFEPQSVQKYAQDEAAIHAVQSGHFGPWESENPTRDRGRDEDYDGGYDEDYDEDDEPPPRSERERRRDGRLTRSENARLFRKLMRL